MTVKEIATLWKEDRKRYIKTSSYAMYLNHIRLHIIPAFGKKTALSEKDVQGYVLDKLEHGAAPCTVRDIVTVLRMIAQYGAKLGAWEPPAWRIKYPSTMEKREIEVLSRKDHQKILAHIKANPDYRNAGIYICLSAGLRIGEICALQWKDIDMDKMILHVRDTLERVYTPEDDTHTRLMMGSAKTRNSVRDIPLTKDVRQLLEALMKGQDPDNFLLSASPRPLEPRTYRYYYHRYMKSAGLPYVRFHGLRHSFATRCIESGCDIKTVSVLLGHSNISTTLNLYVHPNNEQKLKCMETVSRYLSK